MTDKRGIETSATMRPSGEQALEGLLLTNEEKHRVYGLLREQYKVLGLDPAQYPSQCKRSRLTAAKCCLIVESAGRRLQIPSLANDPHDDQTNRREAALIRKQLQSRYAHLGLDPQSFPHVQRRFELDFMECFVTAEILVRFLRRVKAAPVDRSQPPCPQEEPKTVLENALQEYSATALSGLFENTAFEFLLRKVIREEIRSANDPNPARSVEHPPKIEPTIHFKTENGKHWIWRGSGTPSTGEGEWIEQPFKKWPPSATIHEPPQKSSTRTQ